MPSHPQNRRLNASPEAGRRWLLLLACWLAWCLNAAPEVLTLRNGDRLTGEVKSESAERLTLKTPFAGTIKIPKSEIAKREPVAPPLAVTPASPPASPAASPKPAPAPAPSSSPAKPIAIAGGTNPPVAALGALARSWLPQWLVPYTTNWHGSVQLGMDLGMGTADRQTFYGNAYANHSFNRVRNNAEYHVAYGTLNGRESANRMNGRIKTDYDFGTKRRTYIYNTGGIVYDEIRRVDMEFDEGVGLGYKLIQRPKFNVNGELGGQYQNINFITANDRSYLSIRVAESLSWQVSEKLRFDQRLTFLPNVEDLADYRVRFELSASYPLFKRVTISFNAIELYDSAPPPGVDQNDLTLQSSVGINF
jgi:putative salt-induced outer membrane protein YdiY